MIFLEAGVSREAGERIDGIYIRICKSSNHKNSPIHCGHMPLLVFLIQHYFRKWSIVLHVLQPRSIHTFATSFQYSVGGHMSLLIILTQNCSKEWQII
jgi:hypothetical protein